MNKSTHSQNNYLICEHCNHPNALKSHYLTFCEKCGKKIALNFNDWSKSNAGKSFEEYTQLVCKQSIIHWEVETPVARSTIRFNQRTVLFLLAIVAISGISGWGVYQAWQKPDRLQEWAKKHMQFGTTDLEDWEVLRSDHGNFEIRFPGIPVQQKDSPGYFERKIQHTVHRFDPVEGEDINISYCVSYMAFPPDVINSSMISKEQKEEFFNYTLDGFMKKESGVIKSKLDIVYGLYPGKEVIASTQNGLAELKCRFYLVENTLYMLHVTSSYQSSGNKAGDYFLNSFKLLVYAQSVE